MNLDLLQRPSHTLDILLHLKERGPSSVTDVIRELGISREPFYAATRRLEELRLVYKRVERGWPSRVYYDLSAKGEELVEHLPPLLAVVDESLRALREKVERLREGGPGPELLEALLVLAGTLYDCGEWDECLDRADEGAATAQSAKAADSRAHFLLLQGKVLQQRGDGEAARRHLSESLEGATEWRLPAVAAEASYHLASIQEDAGTYPAAEERYREAAEHAQMADDKVLLQRSRLALGRLLARRGLYHEARDMMSQVVDALEELDETYELPRAYANLGATTFYIDEDEALEWHEKAVSAARKACDVRMEAYALTNAAAVRINRGEFQVADDNLSRARQVFEDIGEEGMVAWVENHIGNLYATQEKWKPAEEAFDRALRACRRLGQGYRVADILYHYGQMEVERQRDRKARRLLQESVSLFTEIGNKEKVRRAAILLESLSQ